MREELKEFICSFIGTDKNDLNLYANIRTDLSLDSLSVINIVSAVENEFDIMITEEEVEGIETVNDFLNLVEEKTGEKEK